MIFHIFYYQDFARVEEKKLATMLSVYNLDNQIILLKNWYDRFIRKSFRIDIIYIYMICGVFYNG